MTASCHVNASRFNPGINQMNLYLVTEKFVQELFPVIGVNRFVLEFFYVSFEKRFKDICWKIQYSMIVKGLRT